MVLIPPLPTTGCVAVFPVQKDKVHHHDPEHPFFTVEPSAQKLAPDTTSQSIQAPTDIYSIFHGGLLRFIERGSADLHEEAELRASADVLLPPMVFTACVKPCPEKAPLKAMDFLTPRTRYPLTVGG